MTSFLPHSLLKDCNSKGTFIWRNRGLRFQCVNLGCMIPPLKPPSQKKKTLTLPPPSLVLSHVYSCEKTQSPCLFSSSSQIKSDRSRLFLHTSSSTWIKAHSHLSLQPLSSDFHTPRRRTPSSKLALPLPSYPSDMMSSSLPHPHSAFLRITTFRKPK